MQPEIQQSSSECKNIHQWQSTMFAVGLSLLSLELNQLGWTIITYLHQMKPCVQEYWSTPAFARKAGVILILLHVEAIECTCSSTWAWRWRRSWSEGSRVESQSVMRVRLARAWACEAGEVGKEMRFGELKVVCASGIFWKQILLVFSFQWAEPSRYFVIWGMVLISVQATGCQ